MLLSNQVPNVPQVYLNWSIGAWKLNFRRVFLNQLGNKKVKLGQTILRLLDVSSLKISNSLTNFFGLIKLHYFAGRAQDSVRFWPFGHSTFAGAKNALSSQERMGTHGLLHII